MIKALAKVFYLYTAPVLFLFFCAVGYVVLTTFFSDKEKFETFFFGSKPTIKEHQSLAQPKETKALPYRVRADIVNVRSKPSMESAIIERIYKDQEILVSQIENSWGKVDGGFVFLDPKNLYKIIQEPQVAYRVKVDRANVRTKPSEKSKILQQLPKDSVVLLQDLGNGWGKMQEGFLFLELVEKIDE